VLGFWLTSPAVVVCDTAGTSNLSFKDLLMQAIMTEQQICMMKVPSFATSCSGVHSCPIRCLFLLVLNFHERYLLAEGKAVRSIPSTLRIDT
jgi:hypothetical protein